MSGKGDFLESFSVTCPRCDCRFQPQVRSSPYFARCPDCAEPVRVPASAEIEDDWQREQSESDGETYRLSIPTDWDDAGDVQFSSYPSDQKRPREVRGEPTPKSEPSNEPDADSPADRNAQETSETSVFKAGCPACGANFEATPSTEPQVVLCPECLEDVHILPGPPEPPAPKRETSADAPASESPRAESKESESEGVSWDIHFAEAKPAETPAQEPKKKKKRKKKSSAAEDPARTEKPRKHVDDVLAEIRQVEVDPPPEWTFFSGVTSFLIRPEVLVRWIFASIGFCVFGWLIALCVHFYVSGLIFVLPFFVLPMIWVAIMVLSYAAACSMPILLETSAGNDRIAGWPEPVMKEQAVDLVYLSFLLIVVEVASFFLGQFAGVLFGPQWLVSLVIAFLLYPIVLLSSLEANSPYVPLTWPILRSFKNVAWAWGVFYALSGGLLLAWSLPLVWLFGRSGWTQFFGMILIAPLIAGWCFLYARLLGRLAWRAAIEVPLEEEDEKEKGDKAAPGKTKRKGKKKRKISESSGELQAAR